MALRWADQFDDVCYLDSNQYSADHMIDKILAIGSIEHFTLHKLEQTTALETWLKQAGEKVFGYFAYELRHAYFLGQSIDKTLAYFFKPRYILEFKGDKLMVNRNYPETIELIDSIRKYSPKIVEENINPISPTIAKEDYLNHIHEIHNRIEAGDFYEINYCIEFAANATIIDPIARFWALNKYAKAPFSAFLKVGNQYTLCASPERFLSKTGNKIISQPIKGTARRHRANLMEDEKAKKALASSEKERAENVMIVDLVRNDLSPYAKTGSIHVDELFGIYTFEHVHQMISTISASLENEEDGFNAFLYAFPPGSMTGAPKKEVMKNIQRMENMQRDIYAGSIGYFNANGDYDFNVVIRSIFYDAKINRLSIKTGAQLLTIVFPNRSMKNVC
ncbi:MAG: anthranilate synthase component I family protein [Bacteroidetes bacterium]|nr:anthranilate synthase component I family protein [Bacteroidota bacterium]